MAAGESAESLGNDSLEKRNLAWLVVTGLTASMGAFPISGAVFQAYLLESGLSNAQIGTVGSAVAIAGAGVPLGTYDVAPPSMIAAFNGLRLLLLNGVGALSTLCVGVLLDRVDPLPVFIAGAGLTLVNGCLYWFGFRLASHQTELGTARK